MKLKRNKWIGYQFSSGSTRGSDYIQFEKDCRADLKALAKENGLSIHKFSKMHYEFSAVLTDGKGHFVYVSHRDVRQGVEEDDRILVRTMAHDKDWSGGTNNWVEWENVANKAASLMQ